MTTCLNSVLTYLNWLHSIGVSSSYLFPATQWASAGLNKTDNSHGKKSWQNHQQRSESEERAWLCGRILHSQDQVSRQVPLSCSSKCARKAFPVLANPIHVHSFSHFFFDRDWPISVTRAFLMPCFRCVYLWKHNVGQRMVKPAPSHRAYPLPLILPEYQPVVPLPNAIRSIARNEVVPAGTQATGVRSKSSSGCRIRVHINVALPL